MTVEELKDYLGVDSLEFLSVENLINILGSENIVSMFYREISCCKTKRNELSIKKLGNYLSFLLYENLIWIVLEFLKFYPHL